MDTDFGPLDVTLRGPGEPEVLVIAGVHGDERSGIRAVERLREADLDLQRGVAFVLANPAAIEAGERYLDSDLNRVFPGDPDGDREERIAARLCELVEGRTSLSLHGTNAEPTPFALVHSAQEREFELAAELPVPHVVDHWGVNEHTITTCGFTVEIELAAKNSDDVAAAAEHQARAFLERVNALPDEPPDADPDFFHMGESVPKPEGESYEVHAENFERVPEGAVYASVDGEELTADESFWPIMLSADGSADIFGYRGEKIGASLEEVTETWIGADREPRDGE
ncbi:succinylglutamate desuccinylase/aspartoacylase domain-containing protein [Haloterrigena alkaliphila]|uniref:Succinylglutamate desuccinylase/aspartoacylase family protein n=1 Tax=Haloterrigena alkaliphila TaxID=2816475 RepID=A0A8A2VAJ3_9EURY|nr:succinylglutamate desuccinylase/aspartoacylase family protein [Haloterrigena alkaliphila]QSW99069.1 succinylglutamate desuccinylase/aspartoacylase family protein [Haloterrigena alkaliphila]